MTDLAIMVEQQIGFVKRDLRRVPLLPVQVLHRFQSVEAEPLQALSDHLRSLDFQAGEPKERPYTDEIAVAHLFYELHAQHENTVDYHQLHAAAVHSSELAEEFGVHYDGFFIDVAALHSDA